MFRRFAVVQTVKPRTLSNPCPDVWVYDMGEHLTGFARLTLNAPGVRRLP